MRRPDVFVACGPAIYRLGPEQYKAYLLGRIRDLGYMVPTTPDISQVARYAGAYLASLTAIRTTEEASRILQDTLATGPGPDTREGGIVEWFGYLYRMPRAGFLSYLEAEVEDRVALDPGDVGGSPLGLLSATITEDAAGEYWAERLEDFLALDAEAMAEYRGRRRG